MERIWPRVQPALVAPHFTSPSSSFLRSSILVTRSVGLCQNLAIFLTRLAHDNDQNEAGAMFSRLQE